MYLILAIPDPCYTGYREVLIPQYQGMTVLRWDIPWLLVLFASVLFSVRRGGV